MPDSPAPTVQFVPAPRGDSEAPTTVPSGDTGFAPTATAHPAADTAGTPSQSRAGFPPAPPGYELIERLGGGGMGVVYLAREQASERLVAMKFLRQPGDQESLERFVTELRVLAKLNHPNIVRVLANDFLRADPFFTMEYAPGGPLSRAVEGSGPMTPADAVRLIRTVGVAVALAHAENVIHRDLKPSNILLAVDGTPMVADFGLAKRLDYADPLTRASGVLGTPSYMPPEQISRKNGEVGAWSDVYGLGATLYHLLTGRVPFGGASPEETVTQVLNDPPARPRAIRPELPAALEGIVLKCMEKDPKDRYQTVAELLADLDRYEAGQKPVAPVLTTLRRVRLWVHRHRTTVAALAAVAVLLVAAVWLGMALSRPEKPRDVVAEYQKELKAGKSVTLIGETGSPAWHHWALGPTELGVAHARGQAPFFETIENSMLDLMPDPGVDSYEVKADLCLLRLRMPGGGNAAPAPTNMTGLYFGRVTPDGASQVFLAATYNDFLDPLVRKAGITQAAAQMRMVRLMATAPDGPSDHTASAGKAVRFAPAAGLPAEWRRIRVEISPERVRVFWAADPDKTSDDKMVPLGDYSAEDLERLWRDQRAKLNARSGLGDALPAWSPRLPFGIWCRGGAVAVRNVIVTPLPRK